MRNGKPLCYELYAGLGGWSEGAIANGYECIGFDIEAHDYGTGGYPGELILRDVRSIHGSELADADLILSSSPCQEFSYRAMPWKRAKALPPPYLGIELFNAQFRIQREASEAAGHHIPMVVENVRGAQKWVGQARYHFGSFYLWGDVPALMPVPIKATKVKGFRFDGSGKSFQTASVEGMKNSEGGSWFGINPDGSAGALNNSRDGRKVRHLEPGSFGAGFQQEAALAYREGMKTVGHANIRDGYTHTRHLTNQRESDGVKFSQSGDAWFDGKPRDKMLGDKGPAAYGNKSNSRKAASAMIAKIPFVLADHIARCFLPISETTTMEVI